VRAGRISRNGICCAMVSFSQTKASASALIFWCSSARTVGVGALPFLEKKEKKKKASR
jgi:hypothetical protein